MSLLTTTPTETSVRVVLDENSSGSEPVALSPAVEAALADTGLIEVRPTADGRAVLVPRGRVGAVRVGDVQVEVQPKDGVKLANLLFYLGYAEDPGFRPELVSGERDGDLWPALAYSLAESVDRALERGVLQGYRRVEESLRVIRGRVRFGDQLARRPGQLVPIEVAFDEYSVDTAENQILLAALRRMLGVPGLDAGVRRRLLHLTGRLEGVSQIRIGAPIPRWRPTRLNSRYHGALRLSEIVLRNGAVKPGARGLDVAAFVVTMWDVFEKFVTAALREALRGVPGTTVPQLGAYLAGADDDWRRGQIPMAIDVVHLDRWGAPQLVFDAKYKVASEDGRYANADLYQMLGYCSALGVPEAWLIYAAGLGSGVESYRLKNTSVAVHRCPLDLSREPLRVLKDVGALAQRAFALAEASSATPSPKASTLTL